jgi:hypothetical protein
MAYSTPLRGAEAKFNATRKKYPKLTTLKINVNMKGTISAASISACPELHAVNRCLHVLIAVTSMDPCVGGEGNTPPRFAST